MNTIESEWRDFRDAVLPRDPVSLDLWRDIFRAGVVAAINLRSQGVSEDAILRELREGRRERQ